MFKNGNLGVNFFFVLSGFLITYLLLEELSNSGKVDVGAFYVRRILRIWPLYYGCVAFGFLAFPVLKKLGGEVPDETASPLAYILFLSNFDLIEKGLPDSSVLTVLWSVAIEEQFYALWPWIFVLLPARWWAPFFWFLIFASFAFRLYHSGSPMILEHHSVSCLSDLTIGGMTALFSRTESGVGWIRRRSKSFWRCVYALALLGYLFRTEIFAEYPILLSLDRLAFASVFALIILQQCFVVDRSRLLVRMSDFRLLQSWGRYTYGLYCLHMVAILVGSQVLTRFGWNRTLWQLIVLEGGLSLALACALAYFSYHVVEKRFLMLKARYSKVATRESM